MDGQTYKRILTQRLQRALRNNMTDAERRMWDVLRGRQICGHKFRRQHPYDRYILDFVCLDRKLVVEVDGGQHTDDACKDEERTRFLEQAGFRVLRFWNHEVLTQTDAVQQMIWEALQKKGDPSPPLPLPLRGREKGEGAFLFGEGDSYRMSQLY
ncbi:MAG: DUF559 domain-containing protein [Nitrospirota bacterium]